MHDEKVAAGFLLLASHDIVDVGERVLIFARDLLTAVGTATTLGPTGFCQQDELI